MGEEADYLRYTDEYISEAEKRYIQASLGGNLEKKQIDTEVKIIPNRMCIKFSSLPMAKHKKRLRDFGFKYNDINKIWISNRVEYFDSALKYLDKQIMINIVMR